jgi:hypothetical protein
MIAALRLTSGPAYGADAHDAACVVCLVNLNYCLSILTRLSAPTCEERAHSENT